MVTIVSYNEVFMKPYVKQELIFLELARKKHFTATEDGSIYRTRCRLCKAECFIKMPYTEDDWGYHRIKFTYNRKRYTVFVHRAVYSFFHGEIPDGMMINHKDGNKQNNALSNLEIVTPRENIFHARYVLKTNKSFGETHPFARLKAYDIGRILYYHNRGIYNTKQLAAMFCVSTTQIYKIRKLKAWRSVFERGDKNFHHRDTEREKREIHN
jgi:hypothetical protein